MTINDTEDLKRAAKQLNDLGISHVIITNGTKELIYNSSTQTFMKQVIPSSHVEDVTGAGDAFSSAVIYSWLKGFDIEDTLKAGLVNARKTIETQYTVRQNLDKKQLLRDMEEYQNETIH